MGRLELLCLGTCAAHAASVYDGAVCAAFVVLRDGYPELLVGAGHGAAAASLHMCGAVPSAVVVMSASPAQTADLAGIVAEECGRGRSMRIAAPEPICVQVTQLLELQLLDQPDAVRRLVTFVRLPVGGAPEPLTAGLRACAPAAAPAPAMPLQLWFDDVAVVSFTGPTRPRSFASLCHAAFVVVWAHGDAGERPDAVAPSDVVAMEHVANATAGSGDAVNVIVTGHPDSATAPRNISSDHVCVVQPGTCVPLLVGDCVDSPYAGMELESAIGPPLTAAATSAAHTVSSRHPSRSAHQAPPSTASFGTIPSLSNRSTTPGGQVPPTAAPPPAAVSRQSSFDSPAASTIDAGSDVDGANAGYEHEAVQTSRLPSGRSSRGSTGPPRNASAVGDGAQGRGEPQDDSDDRGNNAREHNAGAPSDATASARRGRADYRRVDGPSMVVTPELASREHTGSTTGRAVRVHVFSNEERGQPGRLLMLHKYRSVESLRRDAAERCAVRPVAALVFDDGEPVTSLADIPRDAELVVTKRGGARYDPAYPPRLMKRARDLRDAR